MNKIQSFEDFAEYSSNLIEDTDFTTDSKDGKSNETQNYMFFQNLESIKNYIEELMEMDHNKIDDMLNNGHDWAADHIAVAKTDIQQVAEWAKNEFGESSDDGGDDEKEPELIHTDNFEVEIENDEDL